MKAIKNGKLITVADGIIEKGTILIENGKIKEIGQNVQIPEGTEIIDAEGMTVTPGFIDAHTHLTVFGEPGTMPSPPGDVNEVTDPVTPQVRMRDSFNPQDEAVAKVRGAGFSSAYVLPGSANIIGGTGIAIKLRGKTVDQMMIHGKEHMKMALGENPKRCYGAKSILPMTRMGNAAVLRKTLFDVLNYIERKNAAEEGKPFTRDFKLESLIPVVKGEMKARIHCHRADDIATAIRVAEEFKLDYSLEHATEGYIIKEVLGEKKTKCVVGPLLIGPVKRELWNISVSNAKILCESGAEVSLTADSDSGTVWLPMHVGVLIKDGLPEEEAYKMLTVNPAKLIGISDTTGSLEVGKDADIAIFDGNPFCNFTSCKMTVIDGEIFKN